MGKITREHLVMLSEMESFSAKEAGEIVGAYGADVVTRLRGSRQVESVEKVCSDYRATRYRLRLRCLNLEQIEQGIYFLGETG